MDIRKFTSRIAINSLALKSLKLTDDIDINQIEFISQNCPNLIKLIIGKAGLPFHEDGSIWNGQTSINDTEANIYDIQSESNNDSEEDDGMSMEDSTTCEFDARLIASNLPNLEVIHITCGLELTRQKLSPPRLGQLCKLKELRLCPIDRDIKVENSFDERNIRILAQDSNELIRLDLRGAYLGIFTLGWLNTEKLESLHIFSQVPTSSILHKWAKTLRYLTLAAISPKNAKFRSLGPKDPTEEIDSCINLFGVLDGMILEQLDLQGSQFSPECLKKLIWNCKKLSYLDTRCCYQLNTSKRARFTRRENIISSFGVPE